MTQEEKSEREAVRCFIAYIKLRGLTYAIQHQHPQVGLPLDLRKDIKKAANSLKKVSTCLQTFMVKYDLEYK